MRGWILFCGLLFCGLPARAITYQINVSTGMDATPESSDQPTGYLGQAQISTLSKFIRFQSAFTFLYGAAYMEGEASFGMSMYLLSPFVGTRPPVQPFLAGGGTMGVGALDGDQRLDAGYYYGAGVDVKLRQRSGMTLSVQQQSANVTSIRYLLGIYWVQGDMD